MNFLELRPERWIEMDYKYLLAGSTGQIGRLMKEELEKDGSVYCIGRDYKEVGLPKAEHVINAAGYTKFNNKIERYWFDNIRLSITLANYAEKIGAHYHQLSSEATAEFRNDVMPEKIGVPIAHPEMNHYALSKVLTEQSVTSIMTPGKLSIYRCSDVVPPRNRMDEEWRRNHWLSILFSAGKHGFLQNDHYPIWTAQVDELSKAIVLIINSKKPGVYHLLGHRYYWNEFFSYTLRHSRLPKMINKFVKQVTPIIRINPPLATTINGYQTNKFLKVLGFEWTYLNENYWYKFAQIAFDKSKEGENYGLKRTDG